MSLVSKFRNATMAIAMGLVIFGSISGAAQAQGVEQEVRQAVAAWEGQGMLFQTEENKVYMVGVYIGIMVVGNDEEALNAATMVCPATIETDLETLYQTGHGRCILTDKDDNKVYAKWACNGSPGNCMGNFTFTGGTGRFKGISGINQFFVQADVMEFQGTDAPGIVKKASAGKAVWPEIHYQLPLQ